MKKTLSRLLSIFLILALVLTCFPAGFGPVPRAYASSGGGLHQVGCTRDGFTGTYVLMYDGPVLLSRILMGVGLKGKTVTADPAFSPSTGIAATPDGSDWKVSYSGTPDASWSCDMTVVCGSDTYVIHLAKLNDASQAKSGTWANKETVPITMKWVYQEGVLTLSPEDPSQKGELSKRGESDDFGLDKSAGTNTSANGKDWIPEVPWKYWIDDITEVRIEAGVTTIGQQVFRRHRALETVTVNGNDLTKIRKDAFNGCSALKTLDLRNCASLTDIGQNVSETEAPFYNSGLETILLPPATTALTKSLLHWHGSQLKQVNLSDLVNLTSIEEEALKKEDTSPSITDSAVAGGLNLDKHLALESIGKNAFRNQTGLNKNLTIASPVLKTIGEGAFSSWDKNHGLLESADLSACAALETIGKDAFLYQVNLTSIKLPNAFTWINKDAFRNCTALGLTAASIAYCVGGNGALYNVNADGSATKVLNEGDATLYWIPTAKGSDPLAATVTIPYSGSEQELINVPSLRPETGSYAISYTLDGSAVSGIPKAKDSGTYKVGYIVTLPDGTTSKTGTITVKITPKSLTDVGFSLDSTSFEYDGNTHAPVLTVKDEPYELVKDTDYKIDTASTTTATDVGNYTITVIGIGNYKDSQTRSWCIVDTTVPEITGVTDNAAYNAAVSFTATDLRLSSVTLQKDSGTPESLTVSGGSASGSAVGNGTYTLTATDYSGNTTTILFTVNIPEPKTIVSAMLSLDKDSFEYDSSVHTTVLTVKDGTTDLVEGTDYTVDTSSKVSGTDVGTYTVSVTGTGDYTGTATVSWNIIDTTKPEITGVVSGAEYTAGVSFTATDLRLSTVTLQKDSGTPESLTVSSGKASGSVTENGTYTIVATDGSGNETKLTFTVDIKNKITRSMLALDEDLFEYDGASHTPALTVKNGATVLIKDTDYTVDAASETSAQDVGTYTISVTGMGAYTSGAAITWRIADTTKPAVTGVSSGTEYSADVNFTVSDLLLESVTLQKDSGTPQSLTVSGGVASGSVSEDGVYTLTAKDTSGNMTIVTFTINVPVPVVTQAETPVFDPAGGTRFRGSLQVTISCATVGAVIRYTTDGTDPSASNGTAYTSGSAITLTRTTMLKAIAAAPGYTDSDIASATYTRRSTRRTEEEVIPDDGPPLASIFPFVDVPETAYYRKAVEWALENGVTGGTTPTTFSPSQDATRAETVTFLWAAAGAPEPETADSPFKDVASEDYYRKAVLWAYEKGITAGVSADEFGAERPVTRGQVITFLWAAAGRPEPGTAENPFKDVAETDYCYKAVLWAYQKGITAGTGEATFSPDTECPREQIVTFLYLYYGK